MAAPGIAPRRGVYAETINPGTGEPLAAVADCSGRRCRGRHRRSLGGLRGMAPGAAARTRPAAEARRRHPARPCGRAGAARRGGLRQSGARDGRRRDDRGGADGVLRRLRHRDEGRVDPDGAGRGEFLRARAAGRRGADHPVQSSLHVLRRQVGGPAGGGQQRHRQAAGAGAALLAAACRAHRRHAAAGRVQRRAGRQGGRRGARLAIPASPRSR